jgi:hypothetical protein
MVEAFNPLVSHFYWIYTDCTKRQATHYFIFIFVFQRYQERDKQCVITADGEDILHLLEDNHSPLWQCFLQILEEFAGQCRQKNVQCYI